MRKLDTLTLFRLGTRLAPYIPYKVAYRVCGWIGALVFWLVPNIRHNVLDNLAHVVPDYSVKQRRGIARKIIKNNIANYYDLFRIKSMTGADYRRQVRLIGQKYADEAFGWGNGILAVAAHTGSFSFAAQLASLVDIDFNLVVEPIEPPELLEFVNDQRQTDAQFNTIVAGGPQVREIFRALKRNEMVCVAVDRAISTGTEQLPFFGTVTDMPTGVAEIALRTGAAIMFLRVIRQHDGTHSISFYPPFTLPQTGDKTADVERGNAIIIQGIEDIIRRDPGSWVVLQKIWK